MYLLDADTLIEAKRLYYAFDLCPGFWMLLEQSVPGGNLRSTSAVKRQLEAGSDELAAWATAHPDFFLDPTAGIAAAMTTVSTWVQGQGYMPAAKATFLGDADAFLVAQALSDGHTVVTHETRNPTAIGKVKIPDVCLALNVTCIRTFQALRAEGAVFELC